MTDPVNNNEEERNYNSSKVDRYNARITEAIANIDVGQMTEENFQSTVIPVLKIVEERNGYFADNASPEDTLSATMAEKAFIGELKNKFGESNRNPEIRYIIEDVETEYQYASVEANRMHITLTDEQLDDKIAADLASLEVSRAGRMQGAERDAAIANIERDALVIDVNLATEDIEMSADKDVGLIMNHNPIYETLQQMPQDDLEALKGAIFRDTAETQEFNLGNGALTYSADKAAQLATEDIYEGIS